ncbi:hypothetical protein BS47DRAFT_1482931 [Hydnum rufescens UP504]|uniref:Enoyl reductase (ER) domain-containing protein n=1 Tax=Hydnum rufescens UP504 TaxID=1448309 RepID=A0A9P6B596_9AGAM|nr:hypothetical protein BS47DRAFT_1482931 [Hydnum rufescens UP504]
MVPYPSHTKALVLAKAPSPSSGHVYDAVIETRPVPALKDGEVLVRMAAAGFNHKELWQRDNQYPNTTVGSVLGSDGAGIVIAAADPNDPLIRKRVFLVPTLGWESDPIGPERVFSIRGGIPAGGTFTEFVTIERSQVIVVPDYLPLVYAAAWPVAGVTAWRAVTVKGEVKAGDNVLITGIGGGVALVALQLCVAIGARVFVTSSDPAKIDRAIELGAVGGVMYTEEKWPSQLGKLLKTHGAHSADLSVIIDSAGGDISGKTMKLLRHGARVVCYGLTASGSINFTIREVLKNIELKGSTMGSRQELIDATAFIEKHRIVPVVSHVLRGLEEAEQGFEILRQITIMER